MRSEKWLVATGAFLSLFLQGEAVTAQGVYEDSSTWVFGLSGWTVDLYAGASRFGRFLLEAPNDDPSGSAQREVSAGTGFAFGGGVGASILPRTQARITFTHTSTGLVFRDDSGTGSELLDADDIGDLSSEMLTVELTRYLVQETRPVVPYASAGLLGAWWVLDGASSSDVRSPTGDTQFRWGGTATIGLQLRVSGAIRLRLEAATAGVGNPFEGSESFLTNSGRTIDEPTRVTRRDYRVGLTYVFGRPDRPVATSSDGRHR